MKREDVEVLENFTRAKRMLAVVRSGPNTRQIWDRTEEANTALTLLRTATYMRDDDMTKLKEFCREGLRLCLPHLF